MLVMSPLIRSGIEGTSKGKAVVRTHGLEITAKTPELSRTGFRSLANTAQASSSLVNAGSARWR